MEVCRKRGISDATFYVILSNVAAIVGAVLMEQHGEWRRVVRPWRCKGVSRQCLPWVVQNELGKAGTTC